MPGKAGGVTVMALNTGEAAQRINLGGRGRGWTMTGQPADTREIKVNDVSPTLGNDGILSGLDGVPLAGTIRIPGQAVGFYSLPSANNPACR